MNNKASTQQKRMFFGLAHACGYDADKVKERAKKKYNLESFSEITKQQLTTLIDLLLLQLEKKKT